MERIILGSLFPVTGCHEIATMIFHQQVTEGQLIKKAQKEEGVSPRWPSFANDEERSGACRQSISNLSIRNAGKCRAVEESRLREVGSMLERLFCLFSFFRRVHTQNVQQDLRARFQFDIVRIRHDDRAWSLAAGGRTQAQSFDPSHALGHADAEWFASRRHIELRGGTFHVITWRLFDRHRHAISGLHGRRT